MPRRKTLGSVTPQPEHSAPDPHPEEIGDYSIPISRFGSRDFTAGKRKRRNLSAEGMEKTEPEILRSQKENRLWQPIEGRDSNGKSWRFQGMSGFPFPSRFPSPFVPALPIPEAQTEFHPNFPPSGLRKTRFLQSEAVLNNQPGNPGFLWNFRLPKSIP